MATNHTDYSQLEAKLQHDCNRSLCRFLALFRQEPVRIDGNEWRQFTHPTWRYQRYPDKPEWHRRFFLPVSSEQGSNPWFPCSNEMHEFYRFFDGLRESPPPKEGGFETAAQAPKIADIGDIFQSDWFPEFAPFHELPIVFTAANGDAIAKQPADTFLWFQLETHEVLPCAQSFSSLLESWIGHHSIGDCHPFDSFGRE